jgi:hypothetical protein
VHVLCTRKGAVRFKVCLRMAGGVLARNRSRGADAGGLVCAQGLHARLANPVQLHSSHVTSSCAECDRTLPNVSTSCVLVVLLLVAVHAFRWLAPRQTRTASQALMCS